MRKSKSNKCGFANTKKVPHFNHPANYRRVGRNKIEYLVFSHEKDKVKLGGKEYKMIPLNDNISPEVRKKEKGLSDDKKTKTAVFPVKYIGMRSALKNERSDLSFTDRDKKLVDVLYKTLPIEYAEYSYRKVRERYKNKKRPKGR